MEIRAPSESLTTMSENRGTRRAKRPSASVSVLASSAVTLRLASGVPVSKSTTVPRITRDRAPTNVETSNTADPAATHAPGERRREDESIERNAPALPTSEGRRRFPCGPRLTRGRLTVERLPILVEGHVQTG